MQKLIYLCIGGVLGTLARYGTYKIVHRAFGFEFPFGTLAVNLAGCFVIGFLASLSDERFFISPNLRIFLMAGFCGAFTTFSTFMLETSDLMKNGEHPYAITNVFLSFGFGYLMFRLGSFLAKQI